MKSKPFGILAMTDRPFARRVVLAEDFSLLTRARDLVRLRAPSPNRPVKVLH